VYSFTHHVGRTPVRHCMLGCGVVGLWQNGPLPAWSLPGSGSHVLVSRLGGLSRVPSTGSLLCVIWEPLGGCPRLTKCHWMSLRGNTGQQG
jgi:hypothetical protein